MYIHLSTDTAVLKRSILAVINLEAVPPQSRMVTDYINSEDDRGRLQYTSEEVLSLLSLQMKVLMCPPYPLMYCKDACPARYLIDLTMLNRFIYKIFLIFEV